ncbi:MAG: hypothetical protein AAFX99_06820 [Myxococcota bacterium]
MMTVWMGCGDEDTTDPAQLGQGTLDSGSSPQEDSGSSDTTILTSGPDTALDSGMALDDVPPDMDLEDTDPPPADTDTRMAAAGNRSVKASVCQCCTSQVAWYGIVFAGRCHPRCDALRATTR